MSASDPSSPLPLFQEEARFAAEFPRAKRVYRRNPRARRYVLRVDSQGILRVTIPRGGSQAFADRFIADKIPWIRRQFARRQGPRLWGPGTLVWLSGEQLPLVIDQGAIRLGPHSFAPPDTGTDWRPAVEAGLRRLAETELPPLVVASARHHQLPLRRVSVRNQRTRWGSCSRRGTVSLNWRLIQTPILVRDYLIAHELAHLREMNHSHRFWNLVGHLYPAWRQAEAWLKQHGRDLMA